MRRCLTGPSPPADTPGEDILCVLYDVFDFIEVCSKFEAVRCSHACSAADAAGDECSMQPQQGRPPAATVRI